MSSYRLGFIGAGKLAGSVIRGLIRAKLCPPGKIIGLNGWLKDYAARTGSVYLDYYSALAAGRAMKKELTVDGLLPNDSGYELMAPLAEQAIAQALGKKQ